MNAESALDMSEHTLVDHLFSDLRTFGHVVMPPQTPWTFEKRLRVELRNLLGPDALQGEIDALLVPNGLANEARAVEYKRVLMRPSAFMTRRPNKLGELPKAVTQANRLASLGFAFPWLIVLVIADTREFTGGGGFVAPDGALMEMVHQAIPFGELHPRVGVVVNEITQCFDRPVQMSGMQGGHLVRLAQGAPQPAMLTDAITSYLAASLATD